MALRAPSAAQATGIGKYSIHVGFRVHVLGRGTCVYLQLARKSFVERSWVNRSC